MHIEMIQYAICGLFTSVPSALVHTLVVFKSSSRSLVLLITWDWDEAVNQLNTGSKPNSSKSLVHTYLGRVPAVVGGGPCMHPGLPL